METWLKIHRWQLRVSSRTFGQISTKLRVPVLARPKSKKQVVTAPLLNAQQYLRVSRVLKDDHYERMSCVTVGVARLRTLTAQWPWVLSKGQNLQPFTVNGDFSYEWKFSNGMINPKQTNKQINQDFVCFMTTWRIPMCFLIVWGLSWSSLRTLDT